VGVKDGGSASPKEDGRHLAGIPRHRQPSQIDLGGRCLDVALGRGTFGLPRCVRVEVAVPASHRAERHVHVDAEVARWSGGCRGVAHGYFFLPLSEPSSDVLNAAMKASGGTSTDPMFFMRFFPAFCFSSSLRLREMSPP